MRLHGTIDKYASEKCRCDECRLAASVYNKERRALRAAAGMCLTCNRRRVGGTTMCAIHREYKRRWHKRRSDEWRNRGLCTECGSDAVGVAKRCQPCRDRDAEDHREARRGVVNIASPYEITSDGRKAIATLPLDVSGLALIQRTMVGLSEATMCVGWDGEPSGQWERQLYQEACQACDVLQSIRNALVSHLGIESDAVMDAAGTR